MKFKLIILFSVISIAPLVFSGCMSVQSSEPEEVVFDKSDGASSDEVFITNSDLKKETGAVPTIQTSGHLPKRVLTDKSEVETILDAFGNKIEVRKFIDHPRVQSVVLRTSADGKQQVTVFGYGDTKMVTQLDEKVLSASADEIAELVQLTNRRGASGSVNFMKSNNPQPTPTLQPLPSSQFTKPVAPVEQQAESKSEDAETPQVQVEKNVEN